MKLQHCTLIFILFILFICALFASTSHAENITKELSTETPNAQKHNVWLKQRFSKQHQKLIPVIAVADIFYACNIKRRVDSNNYQLSDIILKMDKNQLAKKLSQCLGDDALESEIAINFGLLGCFHEQLAHLPQIEREQKIRLVKNAINALSKNEGKKSFTQCVTEQAIHYLK